MAVFDKAFASDIADLIAEMGQTVSIKRIGSNVTSGKGVFVASTSTDVVSSSLAGVSNTANTSKTLLLQGTVSKAPLVGDDVVCSQGTFSIATVDVVNPSGVVCVYKLVCN